MSRSGRPWTEIYTKWTSATALPVTSSMVLDKSFSSLQAVCTQMVFYAHETYFRQLFYITVIYIRIKPAYH